MSVISKTLIATGYVPDAQTTGYTSPAGTRTIIDKYTVYSAAGGTVTVNLVASGGAAGASNLCASKTLAAGETYTFPEIVGHVLEAGDFISEDSAAASTVVRRCSGRQVT